MLRMRLLKLVFAFAVLCFCGVGSAWARHGHHGRIGVVINPWAPLYYPYARPYYYPPPYYPPEYYYPPVVVQSPPPVYIEQPVSPPPPVAAPQTSYWYYCPTSRAYYPNVKKCKVEWQKVLPQPQ
jgi:hypothetical protein